MDNKTVVRYLIGIKEDIAKIDTHVQEIKKISDKVEVLEVKVANVEGAGKFVGFFAILMGIIIGIKEKFL